METQSDAQMRGFLFCSSIMSRDKNRPGEGLYQKRPLSIEEQIGQLKDRGLHFSNENMARYHLANIGYYRLSAYWLPFEQGTKSDGHRDHAFRHGTDFSQVISLYRFDCRLRSLTMEALERIEISVRTHWAHELAIAKGPHAHMNSDLFESPWDHAQDLARIAREIEKSKETFVQHYKSNYATPYLPPIWATVETLSFGSLSRWIQKTKDEKIKKSIAKGIGLPANVSILEGVLHALTPVRNVCAHHGRLWNRKLTIRLPVIKPYSDQMNIEHLTSPSGEKTQTSNYLYNYLLIAAIIMQHVDRENDWTRRLKAHLDTLEKPSYIRDMGFPDDWESMPTWRE